MSGNGLANAYRGEASITLGGHTYVLRLTMNVLAALEDSLDARGDIPQVLLNAGYRTVRAVFYAALTTPPRGGLRALPEETTLAQVGELLDEAGGLFAGSPVAYTYWALVVNAGFLDREEAERIGLLPPGKADASTTTDGAPAVLAEGATATAGT